MCQIRWAVAVTKLLEFTLDNTVLLIAGCNCSTDVAELSGKDAFNTHKEDCRRSQPERISAHQTFEIWKGGLL